VVGYLFIFGGSIYRLPETGLGKLKIAHSGLEIESTYIISS